MNLQTIQKRVEELSAELITISNDLAFLIGGEVQRQSGTPVAVRSRHQLREGDLINISESSEYAASGNYTVREVEPTSYDGILSVLLKDSQEQRIWVQFEQLRGVTVVKGAR